MTPTISDQQRLQVYFSQCGWPPLYYGVVPELARSIKAATVLEVGVAYGYHAADLLRALPHCHYIGIDPYRAGYDADDPFVTDVAALFGEADAQVALDRLYAAVRENLVRFGERARLVRATSEKAAEDFSPRSLDLIFIDGDHRYAAAKADLAAWWPKLREGGIFCGDDYLWPDVKRAVDQFASQDGLKLQLTGKAGTNYPIWVIRKP